MPTPSRKRNATQGDWWPEDGKGRYGVLETSGYTGTDRLYTTYLIVDLANCSEVVNKFSAPGKPGGVGPANARGNACQNASYLNACDRELERAAA